MREDPGRADGKFRRVCAGVINEIAHAVLESVEHRAARDESESVSVDDRRSCDQAIRDVAGAIRVNAIEGVLSPVYARPPEIVAVNGRPRRLDSNNRPYVVGGTSEMPDDDLRVVVGRDDRCRAGTRKIARHDSVWIGSVVLLEPSTVRREG